MISQDLSKDLHGELLVERQRLEHEIQVIASSGIRGDSFQSDETDAVDQHQADDASELFEREKNLTVQRTLETSLHGVIDALRKFDEGSYGLCERCKEPIAEKRLRAMPAATHCIECQSLLEHQAAARR